MVPAMFVFAYRYDINGYREGAIVENLSILCQKRLKQVSLMV